ncbi:MAG: PHP domain-containing protein, partial [Lachnospiraceae bacterium]|nr:PHP domain-containing protein [Lachnospiraceae bacterium]
MDQALKLGHKVVALTDHECLSGSIRALSYYNKIKETNPDFKLILGNEIYLVRDGLCKENYVSGQDRFWHFILLARDAEGHKQLRELSTRAWLRSWQNGRMKRVPTYYQDLKDIVGKNKGHVIGSSACFLPGQKVRTYSGEKNIEDIKESDIILTSTGNWEKINFPTSREYFGEGYSITLTKEPRPIQCTQDHKFLVLTSNKEYSWQEARALKKNDKLVEPIPVISYTGKEIVDIETECSSIIDYRQKSIGQNYSKNIFRLPNQVFLSNMAMRTLGLWLADGHISHNEEYHRKQVGFTFSDKEFDLYYNGFVKQGLFDLGLTEKDIYIKHRPDNHRVDLSINKAEFFYLIIDLFNGIYHAENKSIPDRLLHISKDADLELFFGYLLGDGYFRYRSEKKSGEVVATSISKQLIKDMESLGNTFKLSGSITVSKERTDSKGTHHQESYYLTYSNYKLGTNLTKEKHISHEELIEII